MVRSNHAGEPHDLPAPRALACAAALAMGSLAAPPSFGACGSAGSTIISGASTGPCTLVAGSTLRITTTGELSSSAAPAITADHVNGALDIVNGGRLSGTPGITLTNSTLEGGITNFFNANLAVAESSGTAIVIKDTRLSNGLDNHGTITSGSASGSGLDIQDSIVGSLRNIGNINAAGYGLRLRVSTINGRWSNSGGVKSGGTGVAMDSSIVHGEVINTGDLTAGQHGMALTGSRVDGDVRAWGIISSGADALRVVDSYIGRDLITRGTLTADVHGVRLSGGRLSGDLVNQAVITAASGITLSSTLTRGNVINEGTIAASSEGLALYTATVRGTLQNTGDISLEGDVMQSDGVPQAALGIHAGSVIEGVYNSGSISSSDRVAIQVGTATITRRGIKNSGGTISGRTGLVIDNSSVSGGFSNTGSIWGVGDLGQANGVRVRDSQIIGNFTNAGTITSGNGSAIRFDNSAMVGTITNSHQLVGSHGLRLQGTHVDGSINNSGEIRASILGIALSDSDLSGDLINMGTVTGKDRGIRLSDSTIRGTLRNGGTVAGQHGITLRNTSITDGIDISGSVLADAVSGYAVHIDKNSSVPQLRISGDDTARFSGAVRTVATPVLITSGSTFTLQDGNRFQVPTLENRGILAVAAVGPNLDEPTLPTHAAVATIKGNYLQTSSATFSTQVVDGARYGQLVVSGTATLPHLAKLYVDVANPAQPLSVNRLNNVISAGALVSDGTYTVTSNSQLFNFSGVKDANTVDLKLAVKSSTGASDALRSTGAGNKASGAARVLDSQFAQGISSPLTDYFLTATSQAEVARAVSQSLPLTNALPASQFMLEQITDTLRERMSEAPLSAPGFVQPASGVWIKSFGARMADNQGGASNGFATNVGGTLFGAEATVSRTTRVGVAFAYGEGQASDPGAGRSRNNQLELYQLTAYGSHLLDEITELSVHAGMGHNQSDGRRTLTFGGSNSQASTTVDSHFFTGGVALSRRWALSEAATLTPSLSADYTRVNDDGYRERGAAGIAPLLLEVKARTTDQLLLGFDTRLSHSITPGTQIKGTLGVAYDVIDEGNVVNAAFAGAPGQTFRTPGSDFGPWVLRGGLEFSSVGPSGISLSFAMDMQTRAGYTEQVGQVRLAVPF
ncbi:autotransporter outer membrane beta-barrel domain-containing protein [Pseudomonas sp. Marseille-Q5115]|uniref:autotransporter outer membrane beta-barrel domain-containing protein n=1 Tax=Pseudomonas sp. Marseille-Q5115 TaxID=2866593 RepID=UPI001CE41214|nr:autotransporter outer membrane beta-barrel domain-containing protein [Pseudomonas sp. Marseille-Q5115]